VVQAKISNALVAAQKLIALAAVVTRKVVAIGLQGPARK